MSDAQHVVCPARRSSFATGVGQRMKNSHIEVFSSQDGKRATVWTQRYIFYRVYLYKDYLMRSLTYVWRSCFLVNIPYATVHELFGVAIEKRHFHRVTRRSRGGFVTV